MATICLRPCKLTISMQLFARWWCCSGITISSYLFARWHLFRRVGYLRHQQQVDLWPFHLESGLKSRVTWATSVPILVLLGLTVLDLGPMFMTDRRQTKASLNASALWGGGIIIHIQSLEYKLKLHMSPVQVFTSCRVCNEENRMRSCISAIETWSHTSFSRLHEESNFTVIVDGIRLTAVGMHCSLDVSVGCGVLAGWSQ